jgi:hypothetical protein
MKSFKEYLKEVATNNKPAGLTGFVPKGFIPVLPGNTKKKK